MHTTFTSRARTRLALTGGAVAATLLFAACGGETVPISEPAAAAEPAAEASPATTPATTPTTTEAPAPPAEPANRDAAVKISQTAVGDVLADPNGKTLYAFTNDVEAKSTCYGTCADAWPPVVVDPDFIVSPGLDSGIFATTVRDDGSHQLVAGKYPLYLFAADAKPGDITGQGSGDVWFAVDVAGRLIETVPEQPTDDTSADADAGDDAPGGGYGNAADDGEVAETAAPVVQLGDSELGSIITDASGLTLYLFTPDEAGEPTCTGTCAGAWPPLLVDDGVELVAGEGIEAELSTVPHPDGGLQVRVGTWPVYYFAGDGRPGDITGQGSGDQWFVVAADGTSIR